MGKMTDALKKARMIKEGKLPSRAPENEHGLGAAHPAHAAPWVRPTLDAGPTKVDENDIEVREVGDAATVVVTAARITEVH